MKLHYPLEFKKNNSILMSDNQWCDVLALKDLSINDQLSILKLLADFFPFMPGTKNSFSNVLSEDISKVEIGDSVTFFGGSFYPFHAGHMNCLESCPEKNIVVVPDFNPHKIQIEKNSPWESFITLCRILKGKPYGIYSGFLANNVPNPTADWITKVNLGEVNFLMGDDSFMSLLSWTRPQDILNKLTKLYVVPRDHERPEHEAQVKKVKAINPGLQVIVLPDHPFRKLSSTSFRTLK